MVLNKNQIVIRRLNTVSWFIALIPKNLIVTKSYIIVRLCNIIIITVMQFSNRQDQQ